MPAARGRAGAVLNQPVGLMPRALDDLRPWEVHIRSGASPRCALWGELMSAAARNRGGEKRVFKAIQGGLGAQAAWDQFGIL